MKPIYLDIKDGSGSRTRKTLIYLSGPVQVKEKPKVKACEQCKHLARYHNCGRVTKGLSLVSGEMEYASCWSQRDYPNWVWWRCGKKGRFWEEDDGSNYINERKKRLQDIKERIGGM